MSSAELNILFTNQFGFKPSPRELIFEQKEFEKGKIKRSGYYCCYCCGKSTHAPVMSDRRKLYLCAACFKWRCDFCDGEYVLTVVANGKIGHRVFHICKECDTKENHPIFNELLKCPRQEYLDFKEKVTERRQKALDAMNKAIQEAK